jgi:uncharacterized membrane protein YgaE (UPF0421/DUF939 family)
LENFILNIRIAKPLLSTFKGLPVKDRLLQGTVAGLLSICSASIAYGLALMVHSEQAFWAAITAIAVTQHSYSDTMNMSRDQFMGAMIGGIFGFLGATLGAGHYIGYVITVVVVIISCWCLNVGSAARLGAVTATIVLLVPLQGPIWSIALYRLVEVTLGTASATAVSWLFSRIEHRWFIKS